MSQLDFLKLMMCPTGFVSGCRQVLLLLLATAACASTGCLPQTDNEVVVHAALDREFSEPILNDIGQELEIRVLQKFDQESNKTAGLANGIIDNRNRPQADIFWNNEILHTLRLEKMGLLEVYRCPSADPIPDQFLSSKNQWHGFAARARVLIVNTDLIPEADQRPDSIYDLADPKWKGRCAMARPLYGTTATHAAVLFSELGETAAKKLLTEIAKNASIEGGNKQVALKVASGQYAFGITDTDDAMIELKNANPVAIIFPDQADDQMGALLIPNTLAIIKNGPNPERAKRLIDRLLKPDIEVRLANGPSAQIPLSRAVETKSPVEPKTHPLKLMKVDFDAAAGGWDDAKRFLLQAFPVGN